MELKTLGFNYDVTSRLFNRFNYRLGVIETPIKKEELLPLMNASFADVENILCGVYGEENMLKEKKGRISESLISRGYHYYNNPAKKRGFFSKKNSEIGRFSGEIELNLWTSRISDDKVDIALTCYDYSGKDKNLLDIYYGILAMKDLKISAEAQDSIKRIEFLRQQVEPDIRRLLLIE